MGQVRVFKVDTFFPNIQGDSRFPKRDARPDHRPRPDLEPVTIRQHRPPGLAVTGVALLAREERDPDRRAAMLAGNLCRCTGYVKVFEALDEAAAPQETNASA